MKAFLYDFRSRRPPYESTQEESFHWLAAAHARSRTAEGESEERVRSSVEKHLRRFGCSPSQIARRGHESSDCCHTRWSEMEIFDFSAHPGGAGAGARTAFYGRAVDRFFEDVYAEETTPPEEIIHVTCTGYVAPSGAQKLVAHKGWGQGTRVTHAYHMGCYAALPAIRLAAGQLALESKTEARVDVAHTELCTIHIDPRETSPEQLVVQTLFADGYVRYSVSREPQPATPGFLVIAEREEILPDSIGSMSWTCSDRAMRMSLGRDVPERIASALPSFLERLHRDAGLSFADEKPNAYFAVHPGGPRILDTILDRLALSEKQLAASRSVLHRYGNMSSATLPHVWLDLLADAEVPSGCLVTTLAFGPGLTCTGALLRKS